MSTQQQLLLDLKLDQTPTLENFVVGRNEELLGRLQALKAGRSFDALYLWGAEGSGKSHLLNATALETAESRPVLLLSAQQIDNDIPAVAGGLIIIDDIESLSAEAQIALFRVFNAARLIGIAILLAGRLPPLELSLREDLRTRVGQNLIYEVQTLTDHEKSAALRRHALLRGMRLDDGIVHYLMRHGRRDLPSLMAMLDGLDRLSLEQKRPLTLPLLRELMQSSLDLDPNEPGTI
ncbi:MAG: DnaA regulatory inactivator Hda [Rhodocyclaceae bacterium]|nr:DnaA regulatory inactivator Hda [Rhodocyclaceae bacterium]MBK9625359.1 DnaA regulatory inactivator Hda [Rhodocyclaceae bacterium]MBL0076477.1 DnaA regulatory inactivator Hda [Rhodocyclaceae bacterium]MBP6109646.1 DnaA regulatory inactivator Hda [Rhodocyclaceae bacterium]MBP6278882.1 DnaA regulatory inactivator Hda [Rhodocyclaceae bacterium]